MPTPRKTTRVKEIKQWINKQLSEDHYNKDTKMGMCTVIEKILHDTNQYNGFLFNDNNNTEFDTLGYWTRKYL